LKVTQVIIGGGEEVEDYHVLVRKGEVCSSSNLFDVTDIIKRLQKANPDDEVIVLSGRIINGEQFIENVKNLYR